MIQTQQPQQPIRRQKGKRVLLASSTETACGLATITEEGFVLCRQHRSILQRRRPLCVRDEHVSQSSSSSSSSGSSIFISSSASEIIQ